MTEHADRIWAAAQVLNEVAETEDQSGAINDLLAVANALRSTPAAPQSIRDALYDLRTHSHQPPNGADMPIEYVAFRDVEDLLSRAALDAPAHAAGAALTAAPKEDDRG